MTNLEIALILKEIANFLELKEENPYRIRAYNRGADIIEKSDEDVVRLVQENRLKKVSGIGDKIAGQVEEIIFTGRCSLLEELKAEFPPVLRSILGVPGVGAKTARTIFNNLSINSLEDLKKASEEGKIKELPGLGKKTEEKIHQGIEKLENNQQKTLLGLAFPFAVSLLENLKNVEGVLNAEIGGSIRRKEETVKDIDIALMTDNKEKVKERIIHLSLVRQILAEETNRISFLNVIGLKVDVFLFYRDQFYPGLLNLTGNKRHIEELKKIAKNKGYELKNEHVTEEGNDKNSINVKSEKDIYTCFGLLFIPPELREGKKELELAKEKKLPKLIKQEDIKGDLHLHTNWSDGANSLDDMVLAALNKGYSYIAITDHSRSLKIAGGLSIRKLKKQNKKIEELNEKYKNKIKIFSGVEADILNDGSLDYPDDVLKEMDFVVASIHQGFGMEREKITKRILTAMENPYIKAIGHLKGRLINKREGHDLNFELIYNKAEETGTALEINSSVDRLDLPYYHIINAREYEIDFIINTDAHDTRRLDEIKYGVFVARKGYLDKCRVINTLGLDELENWLDKKPGGGNIE